MKIDHIITQLSKLDYTKKADVRIFILDDRIEIINPGSFPEGVSPRKPIHKPVNALLSNYLYDAGFIEKYGSGIILIKELCKENGNEKPQYKINELETKVIFKSALKIISVDVDAVISRYDLNERQKKAIKHISEQGRITTKEYIQLTKTSLITAKRDLLDLKSKKILVFKGSPKTGYYTFNDTVNDTINDTVKGE